MLAGINDPDIKAFQQELEKRGWSEGRNIHIESRYAPAGTQAQALAKELVAMQPEVIFAVSRPITTALQKETHTIPIVFTYVIDPVGAGFIASFTPWRQPHRPHRIRAKHGRQMAGDAQ